ncbi:spermidine synthase [Priestia megaterium]|nr:spermidine synthase [Priestia megaterium]
MKKTLYLNLLLVSFVIMGLEMTATRLIAPSFGNTVYTWGIIISIFLIGSSIGYILGGRAADHQAHRTLLLSLYFFSLLSIGIIPLIKNSLFPLLQQLPSLAGTTIGVTALYFIPNLLLSSIVPIFMKYGLDEQLSGKRIGNLHMVSAVGSVLGTIVTTFFFVPYLSIAWVIVSLAFLTWVPAWMFFRKNTPLHGLLLYIPLLFCAFPLLSVKPVPQNLLYHTTSLYHDIYVYESDSYGKTKGEYRYMTFGNADTIQGIKNIKKPNELLFGYIQSLVQASTLYAPKSKDIFIVGHGIGTLPDYFEHQKKNVTVAEIDPKVLEVSQSYFGYKGNSVQIGDGRKLLQEESKKDVIILDAYTNTTYIPFHLVTKEFFTLTRNKLNSDGILLINAIGKQQDDKFIMSLRSTLSSVYPHVYMMMKNPKEKDMQNILVMASNEELNSNSLKGYTQFSPKTGEIILDNNTKLKQLN